MTLAIVIVLVLQTWLVLWAVRRVYVLERRIAVGDHYVARELQVVWNALRQNEPTYGTTTIGESEAKVGPVRVERFVRFLEEARSPGETVAYATTYDANGEVLLSCVPLTEAPKQMESDDEHEVLKSEMRPDWSWEHVYRDRSSGAVYRTIVRGA